MSDPEGPGYVGEERLSSSTRMAALYSLIATCEANSVNPVDYLAEGSAHHCTVSGASAEIERQS
jgi:hypothetical protein